MGRKCMGQAGGDQEPKEPKSHCDHLQTGAVTLQSDIPVPSEVWLGPQQSICDRSIHTSSPGLRGTTRLAADII